MSFEWDEAKNEILRKVRGIGFSDAVKVWDDPDRAIIPAKLVGDESRFLAIGKINGKIHAVVFTKRGDTIRLITVRRAHPPEERIYEA